MFGLLRKLFSTSRPSGGGRGAGAGPGTHRARPRVEALEDRLVLSLTLLDLPGVPGRTIVPAHSHLFLPNQFQVQGTVVSAQILKKVKHGAFTLAVPDLSNVTFSLLSDGDATPAPPGGFPSLGQHTLVIKNQEYDRKG